MSKNKVLFSLTGSIACYKACAVISMLVKGGCEVKAACTPAALNFVGLATLEGLTRKQVYADMFSAQRALEHVDLNKWLDLAVICPATANMINKLAAGLADDCVSALALAHDFSKPLLIAPAMNPNMWTHPATRRSVSALKDWGVTVLGTGRGRLACGDVGPGRLQEPEEIYRAITRALKD